MRLALAYVRKKQYLCREKCSFAKIAGEKLLKNMFLNQEQGTKNQDKLV